MLKLSQIRAHFLGWSVAFLIIGVNSAQSATPDTAPTALKDTLEEIESAASRQDINAVIRYYSPDYMSNDGMNRSQLETGLANFWGSSSRLNYETELLSWESEGNDYIAETLTTITGMQQTAGRPMQIETKTRSRQRFQNNQIVSQDILSESTTLKSGINPPNVKVNLPDTVRIGQAFGFDAIVQEPLGNDLLLGAVSEQQVSNQFFSSPSSELDFDLLQAGGLFKTGRASLRPENRWLSAVLVRSDGMTIVTQRLQIVDTNQSSQRR